MTLKKLALSAPLRLAWTVLLYLGVNGFLDKLDIARAGHPPGSYLWIVRNAVVALAVLWFSVRLEGRGLEAAGLVIEDIIEREPYAPEVEYQSRRAYIFARKPGSGAAS